MSDVTDNLKDLIKRDETLSIHTYTNGWVLEVSGRDDNDDWVN